MAAKKSRTLTDLFNEYDENVLVPNKIQAGLASLLAEGPEHYESEADFMRRAGLNATKLAAYRDRFKAHFITVGGRNPKRLWFGDAKAAAKARSRLNLSE